MAAPRSDTDPMQRERLLAAILAAVSDPAAYPAEVARLYAQGCGRLPRAWVSAINAAIRRRWSRSGLERVKRLAQAMLRQGLHPERER